MLVLTMTNVSVKVLFANVVGFPVNNVACFTIALLQVLLCISVICTEFL